MSRLQLALCGGGGGGGGGVYIAQTLYLHSGGYIPLSICTGGLVPSRTGTCTTCTDFNLHCVHAQMVVHGGNGVLEVVPWDGSMWWLHIILL